MSHCTWSIHQATLRLLWIGVCLAGGKSLTCNLLTAVLLLPNQQLPTAITAAISLSQIANNQNTRACLPWPPASLTIFQSRNKRQNTHKNINISNNVLRKERVRTPAATSWGELPLWTGRVRPVTKPLSSTHYDPRQGCTEFVSRAPEKFHGK